MMFVFFCFAFLYLFLGPKLWAAGNRYGYLSPVQLLGERYQSNTLRIVLAICLFMFLFSYLALQAIGIGAGVNAFTGWPYWIGAVYMSLLMILIVVLGGTRGVAWLNVLFGLMFTITFFGFLVWIIPATGNASLSEMAKQVQEIRPGQLSVPGPVGAWGPKALIGLAIVGACNFAWPHVVIGTMQARSITVLRKMTMGMLVFSVFFCSVAMIWGFLVTPLLVPGLEGSEADAVVQMAITNFLPSWAGALTLLAVLAAAISTASVQLMVAGIFVSRDLILVNKPNASDKQLMLWARLGMIVVVLGSLVLALIRPTELGLMLSNIAAPGLAQWAPALAGGLLWAHGTKQGAIAGTLSGVILLVISFFYEPITLGFHPMVVTMVVNVLLYILVSLKTTPVPADVQDKFFDGLEDWIMEQREKERKEEAGTNVAEEGVSS